MDYKKLLINAVLAGLYVAAATVAATNGDITKPVLIGAAVAGLRAIVGYIANKVGRTVPVDA